MSIPLENIYYLLCYAWNKLDEKEQVKVSIDDQTTLLDLFAKILIKGTRVLLKRGIEKNYVSETMELAGVKGKLEMSPTLKTGLFLKQKTICTVDEFSGDIQINQILNTTIYRLIRTSNLDHELRKQLKELTWLFSGIRIIDLNSRVFNRVNFHSNNRFYIFLMKICQIIYENSLPTEKPGEWLFMDFLRDDTKMNRLFEAFLFNFYKIEFPHWVVRKEYIYWQFESLSEEHLNFLPRMETDITIENDREKIIIDAKYYSETLKSKFNNQKINSSNLYQLFSYLINQQGQKKMTYQARGILLYPTVDIEVDFDYWYNQHHIQIKTVNLNMKWQMIEKRLNEIILQDLS